VNGIFPGSKRVTVVLDAIVVAWIVTCAVLAVWVSREVRSLAELSDTVVVAGSALDETADAIGRVAEIPFVGPELERIERDVRAAAASARLSGRTSREDVEWLAVLLGVVVGIGPTVPLLILYVPLRFAQRRERREMHREQAV
jgi:hypothetical protein